MAKSSSRCALAVLHAAGAIALVAVVAIAGPAQAAGGIDTTWSVVPADANGPDGRGDIDIELAAGQAVTEHVAVTNRSAVPVAFAIDANDGYLTAKGYFDMRPSDATPVDGGAWVEVPESVTIAAGATTVVPVKVAIPRNATPGDHPAGVTASVDTISGQVRVQNRVGVRLNIRVTGEYEAKLEVTGMSADYTWSWNPFAAGYVDVTYTLANRGNLRLAPDARVLTSAFAGESDWKDTSKAKAREVMPGATREFTARVTGVWPLGPVTAKLMTIPSPAGGALPGITAERVTSGVTVWALPLPQFLFLVLLVLAFLGLRWNRSRRRRRLERLIALHSRGGPVGRERV
ncbi:hypothetical protein ABGB17_34825 [Sphaerisporangium sp. B11E5]|uniref:COG1470 family protein n=1 Tax=Sphaerisporangium sp. B11E5 TaxID=3153563 RepID=UPI00325F7B9D